jgi:K+-sensing histidine kinase KdpD
MMLVRYAGQLASLSIINGAHRRMQSDPVTATDRLSGVVRRAARSAGLRSYAVALALSAVALAISLLLSSLDAEDSIAVTAFIAAVGLSGSYGGLRSALLATACGALAIDYFFETPLYTLQVTSVRKSLTSSHSCWWRSSSVR